MQIRSRDRSRPSRHLTRAAVLPLCALALLVSLVACQPLRGTDKTRPILFVHGYNFSPAQVDCGGTFDAMIASLRSQGFTGPMIKIGYYDADTNCDVNLHNYGSFGDRDSWKDIAKAFSTYVQRTFTSTGITVDAVGYSMGALVVRGGIDGASHGDSGFSAPIDVEDYVSLGGPHAGAAWYSNFCLWGQCHSLAPHSDDLNWLNQDLNPQGKNGTDSTVIGSDGDTTVPTLSAEFMGVATTNKVVFADVPHSGDNNYTHNAAVLARAGTALANPNS